MLDVSKEVSLLIEEEVRRQKCGAVGIVCEFIADAAIGLIRLLRTLVVVLARP